MTYYPRPRRLGGSVLLPQQAIHQNWLKREKKVSKFCNPPKNQFFRLMNSQFDLNDVMTDADDVNDVMTDSDDVNDVMADSDVMKITMKKIGGKLN